MRCRDDVGYVTVATAAPIETHTPHILDADLNAFQRAARDP
jgi:hypothetical protein